MKSFRLWLLLLLAVLLPIRGALAAGMLCPVAGSGAQVEARQAGHAHVHDAVDAAGEVHGQPQPAQHDHAGGHAHPDDGGHDHGGTSDKCNHCSTFCSVPGLVSASMTLAEPQPVAMVFPHLDAPPPSFVSDGQERPPRSI